MGPATSETRELFCLWAAPRRTTQVTFLRTRRTSFSSAVALVFQRRLCSRGVVLGTFDPGFCQGCSRVFKGARGLRSHLAQKKCVHDRSADCSRSAAGKTAPEVQSPVENHSVPDPDVAPTYTHEGSPARTLSAPPSSVMGRRGRVAWPNTKDKRWAELDTKVSEGLNSCNLRDASSRLRALSSLIFDVGSELFGERSRKLQDLSLRGRTAVKRRFAKCDA